jgi:hypothetical protein
MRPGDAVVKCAGNLDKGERAVCVEVRKENPAGNVLVDVFTENEEYKTWYGELVKVETKTNTKKNG